MPCKSLPTPVFELCIDDGGKLPHPLFRRLAYQLNDTGSLDHTCFDTHSLTSYKGSVVFVILHPGKMPKKGLGPSGRRLYSSYTRVGGKYWLAGMCHLYFPSVGDHHTAHLAISLLSLAREKEFGRAAVNKLIEHAFDVLRVHRLVAPIVCPARPGDTDEDKKRAIHETMRLCWVFEQYGFKFEGISRGEVASPRVGRHESPVWQDVYRMSMLDTDYLAKQMTGLFGGSIPRRDMDCPHDPYESMVQRQEQEKRDMVARGCGPTGSGVPGVDEDGVDYSSDEYGDAEDLD